MIGRFWVVHHRFFGEVTGFDGRLLNLSMVALVGALMAADARRAGLVRTSAERAREFTVRSLFIAAVFLASIPLAFVAPDYAPLLWLALFLDPASRLAHRP